MSSHASSESGLEMAMADMKKFQLEVISPERVFYTGEVEMVELTTTEGDIGAVSDTHLDVYKRQILLFANPLLP